MTPRTGFTPKPSKLDAILRAGEAQLSPEEFDELRALLFDLEMYGLTPWINTRLGTIMSKLDWELDLDEPQEWHQALIACDEAFLGRQLKSMCYDFGLSPMGHKKELCARLYRSKHPEVMMVMEPHLKGMTAREIKKAIDMHGQTVPADISLLPQTEPLWADKVRQAKDRLEHLHKVDPSEFYDRKNVIRRAIDERKKGKTRTLAEFSLEELEEILHEAEMLYR